MIASTARRSKDHSSQPEAKASAFSIVLRMWVSPKEATTYPETVPGLLICLLFDRSGLSGADADLFRLSMSSGMSGTAVKIDASVYIVP